MSRMMVNRTGGQPNSTSTVRQADFGSSEPTEDNNEWMRLNNKQIAMQEKAFGRLSPWPWGTRFGETDVNVTTLRNYKPVELQKYCEQLVRKFAMAEEFPHAAIEGPPQNLRETRNVIMYIVITFWRDHKGDKYTQKVAFELKQKGYDRFPLDPHEAVKQGLDRIWVVPANLGLFLPWQLTPLEDRMRRQESDREIAKKALYESEAWHDLERRKKQIEDRSRAKKQGNPAGPRMDAQPSAMEARKPRVRFDLPPSTPVSGIAGMADRRPALKLVAPSLEPRNGISQSDNRSPIRNIMMQPPWFDGHYEYGTSEWSPAEDRKPTARQMMRPPAEIRRGPPQSDAMTQAGRQTTPTEFRAMPPPPSSSSPLTRQPPSIMNGPRPSNLSSTLSVPRQQQNVRNMG